MNEQSGGELVEFTLIGSTVNVASRVEHLSRRHAADILITAAVREVLDARFALQELPSATAMWRSPQKAEPSRRARQIQWSAGNLMGGR